MLARKIEISHRTVIFTVLFLVGLWLLYLIRDILLQFFISVLLMTILNPLVTKLAEHKIPRGISVILVYLLVLVLVVVSVAAITPSLVEQSTILASRVPSLVDRIGAFGPFEEKVVDELISVLGSLPASIAKLSVTIFSNIINILVVSIFTYYLLLSRNELDEQLGNYFGKKVKERTDEAFDLIEKRLGGWLRGQIILMLVVAVATYIGLFILDIPFAVPLAMLAGLLEVIPNLGPTLSAVPAVLIGLGISPLVGLAVVALYFLIQQVENYFLVPRIMSKNMGLSPIVTLLALAIGFRVAGIAGAVISIPVVAVIQVLADEYLLKDKKVSETVD